MQIKTKIKQSFTAAATSYDGVAALQRQVGLALLEQCGALPATATVLDIGCGTGFMLGELLRQQKHTPELMLALDMAEPMLQIARRRLGDQQNVLYICADAENLPLQAYSVDVAVSNLSLQWCHDLVGVFKGIKHVLTPDGRFIFNTFGAGTLQELKQAWQQVDSYQHVNDFYNANEISDLLRQAELNVVDIAVTQHQILYSSVYDLMRELKRLGARTVMGRCNPNLTSKATMQRMLSAYPKQADGNSILATFVVISGSVAHPA